MAHVAHFKFPNETIDTIPAELAVGIPVLNDFKDLLVDLYTTRGGEAACGTGKLIFGKAANTTTECVLFVSALIIQWDAGGAGSHLLMFHLTNVSSQFQIV